MATPGIDDLSPLAQLAVLVIGAVASALAWLAGQRNQAPSPNGGRNGFQEEIDSLRRDLEHVLFAHRESINVKIDKQIESIRSLIDRGSVDAKGDSVGIFERLRQLEISVAEIKARLPPRRGG